MLSIPANYSIVEQFNIYLRQESVATKIRIMPPEPY